MCNQGCLCQAASAEVRSADQRLEKLSCNCGWGPSPTQDAPPRGHTGRSYDKERVSATRESVLPQSLAQGKKKQKSKPDRSQKQRQWHTQGAPHRASSHFNRLPPYRAVHSWHEPPSTTCSLTHENMLIHMCAHHTYKKIEKGKRMSSIRHSPRMRENLERTGVLIWWTHQSCLPRFED